MFKVVFKTKQKRLVFVVYTEGEREKKKTFPNSKRFRRFVDVTNGVCLPLGKKITPKRLLTAKS